MHRHHWDWLELTSYVGHYWMFIQCTTLYRVFKSEKVLVAIVERWKTNQSKMIWFVFIEWIRAAHESVWTDSVGKMENQGCIYLRAVPSTDRFGSSGWTDSVSRMENQGLLSLFQLSVQIIIGLVTNRFKSVFTPNRKITDCNVNESGRIGSEPFPRIGFPRIGFSQSGTDSNTFSS